MRADEAVPHEGESVYRVFNVHFHVIYLGHIILLKW